MSTSLYWEGRIVQYVCRDWTSCNKFCDWIT